MLKFHAFVSRKAGHVCQLLCAGMFACLAVTAGQAREIEPLTFYVNYSVRVPSTALQIHPLAITHPDADIDLPEAHRHGTSLLAYLSVGEIAADASYRVEALRMGLPLLGKNPIWNSDYIDLTDTRWSEFLVDTLAARAAEAGYDGFFLDTVDSVTAVAPHDEKRTAVLQAALVNLVRRLRATYPQKQIVVNRGFFAFDQLRDSVDGVLIESLYSTWDFKHNVYRSVPESDTRALLVELDKIKAAKRAVYVIDYASPNDPAGAQQTADRIRSHGFHAFVSTPALNGRSLAPLRPVPRRVCSFFGNLAEDTIDRVDWPAGSFTAKRLQTQLEWLGYEVDYFKILTAADLPVLDDEYRAIVLPRFWEFPPAAEAAVVDWLIAQKNEGRKILIFGALPFSEPEQLARFIQAFGLRGTGSAVEGAHDAKFVTELPDLLSNETQIRPNNSESLNLQAPAGAQVLLGLQTLDAAGQPVRFDAIFVSEWGGAALNPYLLFQRADFTEFWNPDPFAFLKMTLGELAAPVPDTTTRDGLRMLLSHIDGDGFSNKSWTSSGQRSAEIIRDRILKKYPIPVTVSIIEAELRGLVVGQNESDVPELEAIARSIFELPQVDAASHSFSHPFFWIEGDPTESFYEEQNLELKQSVGAIDYQREIDGTVRYINERLAPAGRPVTVFLWSGNCRPPPAALARVRELGLVNLNGGDTIVSPRHPTINAVAPRTMSWGNELQILAPNQNENVYTNNWQGPLFGTFIHVIDTFKRTESPRRLKPVNIYYHFYSGDYPASLNALETIHDWAVSQPLHSVTVAQYARMARDARNTRLFSADENRWIISNEGESRTLRLPAPWAKRISMEQSQGITGWQITGDVAYVHTDGSPVTRLVLSAQASNTHPYLESSSGEIEFSQLTPRLIEFEVSDLRPVTVVLAGLPFEAPFSLTINGAPAAAMVDNTGHLTLNLPAHATVSIIRPRQ